MDKDLEDKLNQLWNAVYNLQHDVDSLMFPSRKILYAPKIKTEESMREGIRRGIGEARKSESFLKQPKPILTQTALDSWVKKSEEWSDVQWEQWAKQLYTNYPEARQYLPDWFIKEQEKH